MSKLVSNVEVFALDRSIITAGYPMVDDMETYLANATVEDRERTAKFLAKTAIGEGHDNWLNGIIVQFDLDFTLTAWKQMQRYHFIDFVSSTSTMHRIKTMDIRKQCSERVRNKAIENLEEIVAEYHEAVESDNKAQAKELMLDMYDNIPTGFKLLAGMTTNYRQLKTIYEQRRNHKLPIWHEFCEWIETLPHSELITSATHKKIENKKEMTRLKKENEELKSQFDKIKDVYREIDMKILDSNQKLLDVKLEELFKKIEEGIK